MTIEIDLAESPTVTLAYAEWALDPATGDYAIPMALLHGVEAVLQRMRVRCRFFKGEWFLDTRIGVPYFDAILIKNPDTRVIETIFREVFLGTPGVARVPRMQAAVNAAERKGIISFEAVLEDGTIIRANAEPFIIGDT